MDQDALKLTSVRLTRKYAEKIDGVDLSRNQVGDLLDLSAHDARMLIAEGWAQPYQRAAEGQPYQRPADGDDIKGTSASDGDSDR